MAVWVCCIYMYAGYTSPQEIPDSSYSRQFHTIVSQLSQATHLPSKNFATCLQIVKGTVYLNHRHSPRNLPIALNAFLRWTCGRARGWRVDQHTTSQALLSFKLFYASTLVYPMMISYPEINSLGPLKQQLNPIHPIGNSSKKQKPCTKV